MKHAMLVAAFLLTSTGASAQTASWTFDNRDPSMSRLTKVPGDRECLIEKSTGHHVCRTRAEWKQIADRIARGENWRKTTKG